MSTGIVEIIKQVDSADKEVGTGEWPLFGKPISDLVRANDLCWVEVFFQKGPSTKYLLHESEVPLILQAQRRLHHNPGINPYNQSETARIWKITQMPLALQEDYWWTKPGLDVVPDEAGAHIIEGGHPVTLWVDQNYIDRVHAEL